MSWSRSEVQLLIDLYQKNACLYAVKSPLYKNKHARNTALTEIEIELKKVKPEVTIPEIKAKFNNLRTNFLSEYKKYKTSVKSGMAGDEVYRPSLWYFDKMAFVIEHSVPRPSKDSIVEGNERVDELVTGELEREVSIIYQYSEDDNGVENIVIDIVEQPTEIDLSSEVNETSQQRQSEVINVVAKNKRKRINEDDVLNVALQTMQRLTQPLNSNAPNSNGEKQDIQAFAEFIKTKLNIMADNLEILEETEEQITNIIFNNLRIYRDNKRNL